MLKFLEGTSRPSKLEWHSCDRNLISVFSEQDTSWRLPLNISNAMLLRRWLLMPVCQLGGSRIVCYSQAQPVCMVLMWDTGRYPLIPFLFSIAVSCLQSFEVKSSYLLAVAIQQPSGLSFMKYRALIT